MNEIQRYLKCPIRTTYILSTTWRQCAARQWLSGKSAWLAMDKREFKSRMAHIFNITPVILILRYIIQLIKSLLDFRKLKLRPYLHPILTKLANLTDPYDIWVRVCNKIQVYYIDWLIDSSRYILQEQDNLTSRSINGANSYSHKLKLTNMADCKLINQVSKIIQAYEYYYAILYIDYNKFIPLD